LENFAYVASHDLQEPLRKIMVFTDILQQEVGTGISEKGGIYMKRIAESVTRMQRLIDDVLQFAGVRSATEFTMVNLNETVSRIISDMEITISKSKATITVEPLPEIEGNLTQMQQLFQNLISNALKFSEADPVIHISSEILNGTELPDEYRQTMRDKFHVTNDIADRFCRIFVKDNGIGFDETYHARIFSAFQRLHSKHDYEGTGIGLAIVRKLQKTITG